MGHVFSHRTGWENIDTKFCHDRTFFYLSLNWALFCYDRTRFSLLHLAIGVQAGHFTFALHSHTTAWAALHNCTLYSVVHSYKTTRFLTLSNNI